MHASAHSPAGAANIAAVRQCTKCGATVELHGTALSTLCSYCESPLVDVQRAESRLDRVAPFRLVRATAEAKLRSYLRGKFWAPRAVKALSVDPDKLRGVLVPHWSLRGVVRSRYEAKVGIHWYRTETYTDSDGNTRTRRKRETEWFDLKGTAARQVEDHLVSASIGLEEAESNALEPFDLGWAVTYDPRFLSGFEAEIPSIARGRATNTATVELREHEVQRIAAELLPGDENRLERCWSEVDVEQYNIVLLPVWIGTFTHKDKVLRLQVNGQTGKCVGQVPVSKVKVAVAIILAILAVTALILYFVFANDPAPEIPG